jgi:hypothetical protein
MRVIIAGGRDYTFTEEDVLYLFEIAEENNFTEVVSGCAKGADSCGEIWALSVELPIKKFPAQWDKYGNSAGHKRNKQMAQYAHAVVLFPGGKGTDNMFENAKEQQLMIFDKR